MKFPTHLSSPLLLAGGLGAAVIVGIIVWNVSRPGEFGDPSEAPRAEESDESPAAEEARESDTSTIPGSSDAVRTETEPDDAAPAEGPYSSPASDTEATRIAVRRTMSEDETVSLTSLPDTTLTLTDISGSEASFQLRSADMFRYKTLAPGSSAYLATVGAYTVTLDLFSVVPDDDRASVRIHIFPSTRAAPRAPATLWVYPFQTMMVPNLANGTAIKIEPTTILSNKMQIRLTELSGGDLAQTRTEWIRIGETLRAQYFSVRLNAIEFSDSDFYDSSLATWGPHLSEFTVRTR